MASFKESACTYLDISTLRIPKVFADIFRNLENLMAGYAKVTVVLPSATFHFKDGFDGDTRPYNQLNLEMILRSCSNDEFVLYKFHPSIYRASSQKITLGQKLRAHGFSSMNVDDLLPSEYRGEIPVEIIVMALGIKKLVSECSASMWNLVSVSDVEVVADPFVFDGPLDRKSRLKYYAESVNLNSKREVKILTN
jgi:hypothetical protein